MVHTPFALVSWGVGLGASWREGQAVRTVEEGTTGCDAAGTDVEQPSPKAEPTGYPEGVGARAVLADQARAQACLSTVDSNSNGSPSTTQGCSAVR